MHEIRFAGLADVNALMRFIDEHWKQNHIFVTCKPLLDWQHLDKAHGRYNFVIGVSKQSGAIHGILGFIPLAQFDPGIEIERLIWMAIWKVVDAARGQKLGQRLLTYLEETLNPEVLSTVAASAMSMPIYRARGYQTGRLEHYFIVNPDMPEFKLADLKGTLSSRRDNGDYDNSKVVELATEKDITDYAPDCFAAQKALPIKSPEYLINRYMRHPIYDYQAYRIVEGQKTSGFVITRLCSHEGARAIRIVDFIGPSSALAGLGGQWDGLLKASSAEYIDFYCAGIDQETLNSSGFTLRQQDGDIVIPNYYEPFLRQNVEMDYMIHVPAGRTYRLVKGDSDQDRPNIAAQRRH